MTTVMNETGKRILVVEDNASNMELIRFIFVNNGYCVFEAFDGMTGVERAKALKPDIILMDIQLPVMDGLEATRQIRRLPGFRKTPIVAITSYAMLGDRKNAIKAGCNGYIEKPIDTDTIVADVERFMK